MARLVMRTQAVPTDESAKGRTSRAAARRTGTCSSSAENQIFSDYEQTLFTKTVSVAESYGKHISLLVVPALGRKPQPVKYTTQAARRGSNPAVHQA